MPVHSNAGSGSVPSIDGSLRRTQDAGRRPRVTDPRDSGPGSLAPGNEERQWKNDRGEKVAARETRCSDGTSWH
jgi:hypothetical protein